MASSKRVAAVGDVNEMWGSALKESGFQCEYASNEDEASQLDADCFLIDSRGARHGEAIAKLPQKKGLPILSLIDSSTSRDQLLKLKESGVMGYLSHETPAEEVVVLMQSLLKNHEHQSEESRGAERVWFQQKVHFKAFDQSYSAWSTTISETGMFLRTSLSFPLYTVLRLQFYLWGDSEAFECDAVVVRQEVDGPVKGLGVMFQNLKGENVQRLQAFFDLYR